MIISDALYRRFPEDDEGTLTRIKSQAVSRAALQRVAAAMGLERYIFVGKGVAKREIPASLLGNLFEAIVGAIYLDAGLAASRKFVLRHLDVVMEEIVEDRAERNYKSMLQHHCQRDLGGVPSYRVLREGGPAHNRSFEVAIFVNGKEYGRARAASKKEAEQGAARAALLHFKVVQESPKQPVRGAGTLLRVGPDKKGRKRSSRRRGGGGNGAGGPSAPTPAPAESAPAAAAASSGGEAPAPAKKSRRKRSGRGGRGRSREGGEKPAAPAEQGGEGAAREQPAAQAPAPEKRGDDTASKPEGGAGDQPKKKAARRRRRRGSDKNAQPDA